MPPRKCILISALFLLALSACQAEERRFESLRLDSGEEFHLAYFLPAGFDPQRTYPVLVAWGEAVPGSRASFFWRTNRPSDLKWILAEVNFGQGDLEKKSRLLFKHLNEKFRVEGERFHLACWSAGSGPTFTLAMEIAGQLASITAIPGHPQTSDPQQLKKFKDVKVHFIVGENDGYWLRGAQTAHQRFLDLGVDSALDVVSGGGHVLTDIIGAPLLEKMEAMRRP